MNSIDLFRAADGTFVTNEEWLRRYYWWWRRDTLWLRCEAAFCRWLNTRSARLVFTAYLAAILIWANTYGALMLFCSSVFLAWICKPLYQFVPDEARNA